MRSSAYYASRRYQLALSRKTVFGRRQPGRRDGFASLMQTLRVGKLVRDGIPDLIRRNGGNPSVRILEGIEYTQALFVKLREEALEALEASGAAADHLGEELADCLEVLHGIAADAGLTWSDVADTAARKKAERGGFEGRTWLD